MIPDAKLTRNTSVYIARLVDTLPGEPNGLVQPNSNVAIILHRGKCNISPLIDSASGYIPCYRLSHQGLPEKDIVIESISLGNYTRLTLYRSLSSMRDSASWWATRAGTAREGWKVALDVLEEYILCLAKHGIAAGGIDIDMLWSRFQKLKTLALRPGTKGEQEAAKTLAVATAKRLALL